jgi:hypothetical protein
VITLAALSQTQTLHTNAGVFSVHQMAPSFFDGFGWYKGSGSFLIAEPEKALIDCLYLSSRKKNNSGIFPNSVFRRCSVLKKRVIGSNGSRKKRYASMP